MTTARTVGRAGLLAALAALAVGGAAGCVERKFVVESNVPNAQVYIDNKSVGAAPAYSTFDYYGYYTIAVVHPGYTTVVRREHAVAPWYAYPPLDLLADIAPFPIRDTRRVYVELTPAPPVRPDGSAGWRCHRRKRPPCPGPKPPPRPARPNRSSCRRTGRSPARRTSYPTRSPPRHPPPASCLASHPGTPRRSVRLTFGSSKVSEFQSNKQQNSTAERVNSGSSKTETSELPTFTTTAPAVTATTSRSARTGTRTRPAWPTRTSTAPRRSRPGERGPPARGRSAPRTCA